MGRNIDEGIRGFGKGVGWMGAGLSLNFATFEMAVFLAFIHCFRGARSMLALYWFFFSVFGPVKRVVMGWMELMDGWMDG